MRTRQIPTHLFELNLMDVFGITTDVLAPTGKLRSVLIEEHKL